MNILDLSLKSKIKRAKFWSNTINQLYHPTGVFEQDTIDLVYAKDSLNLTKFVPILIKEWFYLLKKDGYLVIDYKQNAFCDFQKLEETMWWLWQGKFNIVFHGPILTNDLKDLSDKKLTNFLNNIPDQSVSAKKSEGYLRFVCKKLESTKKENDEITKWTFGIITKGDRNDWMEEIIKSIRAQKIPNYEIIVCGTYFDRGEKDFKYIPFFERDDKGWITKKKNVIAKEAKYENLCVIHDRIIFDINWFKGLKEYGNCFDVLCNAQTLKGVGSRTGDWLTYGSGPPNSPYGISELKYDDWDNYVYMGGQLSILKKSVWEKCLWNETLYWGEEDVELSFRFRDNGSLIRFNNHSSCTALAWRFGKLPAKYYRSEGLLPKDMKARRLLRFFNRLIFSIPMIKKITFPLVERLVRSKFYKLVIR